MSASSGPFNNTKDSEEEESESSGVAVAEGEIVVAGEDDTDPMDGDSAVNPATVFCIRLKQPTSNLQFKMSVPELCRNFSSNANPPFWIPIHIVIPERPAESTVFNVIADLKSKICEKRSDKEPGRNKIHDGKYETRVLRKEVENESSKRVREGNECPTEKEMRNIELEKELKKRMKRREIYNDRNIKHKDIVYNYKENAGRVSKSRDVMHQGESEKDNKHINDKHREDFKRDMNREDKYHEDSNRDYKHKEERYKEDVDWDHMHKTSRPIMFD